MSTTKINDDTLNELAQHFFEDYAYFSVGTGNSSFNDADVSLNNAVEISSGVFNKLRETGSISSFRSNNQVVLLRS